MMNFMKPSFLCFSFLSLSSHFSSPPLSFWLVFLSILFLASFRSTEEFAIVRIIGNGLVNGKWIRSFLAVTRLEFEL